MARALPAAVAAFLALAGLAGCGGGSDERNTAVGGTAPLSSTVTTVAAAADAAGPTSTTGPSPSGNAGPSGTADAPSPPAPQTSSGWAPPAAGTYRYDTSGVSTFALTTLPFPGVTTLVVDPPDGTRQHATRDLRDGAGNGMVQETFLDYRSEGILLESIKLTAYFAGTTNAIDLRPVGAALFLPASAGPGTHVELQVTDGAGNATVVVDVVGREQVAVGGQAVDALVVRMVASLPGPDVSGQVEFTNWFAPGVRLAVKERVVSDANAGGLLRFHSEYQATLQRL